MPDLITASVTRDIVSYGIERIQDGDRKLFPTDLELFDYINVIVKELARFSKLLKSDIFIPLVPNQTEYSYISVLDRVTNVIQIETVTVVDINGTESLPLIFKNKKYFRNVILPDTTITLPAYYTYDKVNIAYWRPTPLTTDRLKLRVARDLLNSEKASQIQDPPDEIVSKFEDYIKYGLVKEMALKLGDAPKAENYNRLYQGYREVELIPATLDSHKTLMTEF